MTEYLTLAEAADYIRLSPSTLRRAFARGEIGAKRGRLIFRADELDAWWEKGRSRNESPDPMPATSRSETASLRELVRSA